MEIWRYSMGSRSYLIQASSQARASQFANFFSRIRLAGISVADGASCRFNILFPRASWLGQMDNRNSIPNTLMLLIALPLLFFVWHNLSMD